MFYRQHFFQSSFGKDNIFLSRNINKHDEIIKHSNQRRDLLEYASVDPPALTIPEYLEAQTEVRLLGSADYANTDYDEIFNFRKAGGGSVRPPGEWIKTAQIVAKE